MNDPKLVRSSVTIRYRSDDGYSQEQHIKVSSVVPPQIPLLEALEELARLTALFGFQDEALSRFNAARERVADWRAKRGDTDKTEPAAALKRYWLFAGHNYYPSGGMEDFIGDFDSLEDAKCSVPPEIKRSGYHWAHVFDMQKREIVWKEFT